MTYHHIDLKTTTTVLCAIAHHTDTLFCLEENQASSEALPFGSACAGAIPARVYLSPSVSSGDTGQKSASSINKQSAPAGAAGGAGSSVSKGRTATGWFKVTLWRRQICTTLAMDVSKSETSRCSLRRFVLKHTDTILNTHPCGMRSSGKQSSAS